MCTRQAERFVLDAGFGGRETSVSGLFSMTTPVPLAAVFRSGAATTQERRASNRVGTSCCLILAYKGGPSQKAVSGSRSKAARVVGGKFSRRPSGAAVQRGKGE